MKLREKLALPFVVLVLMAAVVGGAGLLVVARINASVSTLSDITSPLLLESTALLGNAHHMRSVFQEGTNGAEPREKLSAALAHLHDEGRKHLATAERLAAQIGLQGSLERVGPYQDEFVSTLQTMAQAHERKRQAARTIDARSAAAVGSLKSADDALHAIIAQMERIIIESEEKVKVQIQTGIATSESVGTVFAQMVSEQVWVLQNSHRLLRATAQLFMLVENIAWAGTMAEVDAAVADARAIFKAAPSLQRKIASRLGAPDYQPSRQQLAAALQSLESTMLGIDGLIAAKRTALTAKAAIDGGARTLDGIETRYFALLGNVEATVQARNEAAKLQAVDAASLGRGIILGLILLSGVFAASAAVFLRRRILAPVNAMAGHMTRVGESGALDPIAAPLLTRSSDEIGDLALAFNGMLAELADARRQLVERSEAEVSRQVERLEAALTNMSQGLCMFDREQRLVVSNRQYAEIYDIAPEKVHPGMTLRDVLDLRAGGELLRRSDIPCRAARCRQCGGAQLRYRRGARERTLDPHRQTANARRGLGRNARGCDRTAPDRGQDRTHGAA